MCSRDCSFWSRLSDVTERPVPLKGEFVTMSHEEGHARPHKTAGKTAEAEEAEDVSEGNAQAEPLLRFPWARQGGAESLMPTSGIGALANCQVPGPGVTWRGEYRLRVCKFGEAMAGLRMRGILPGRLFTVHRN